MDYIKVNCTEEEYQKAESIFMYGKYNKDVRVLADNLKRWYYRVKFKNFPVILLIDGISGQGKTTFAIKLMDFINFLDGKDLVKLEIKEHYQIGSGAKGFITAYNQCRKLKLPCVLYSEAGDVSRGAAMTKVNKMIIRHIETFRSSKIIMLMDLPNFNILDKKIFNYQGVRALFHLDHREKLPHGTYYCFSIRGFKWIRWWFDALAEPLRDECYKHSYWNFRGNFKNLTEERKVKLARISDTGKIKESLKAEMDANGLISSVEAAQVLGLSYEGWNKFKRNKHIEVAQKSGLTNYYSKDLIMGFQRERQRKKNLK